MFRSTKTLIGLLAASALIVSACSSSDEAATTTTTSAPAATTTIAATTTVPPTTMPPTTTTTVPTIDVSESINGLEVEDEQLINRRVAAVKLDNHPRARPHVNLNEADVVYETLVEGGLTRFIALYHTKDFEKVGPNRSGRPTDSKVLKPLHPVFQVSGAQGWVKNIFRRDGINVLYDNGVSTFRDRSRSAPHNLFANTYKMRELADKNGWTDQNPGNLFLFGDAPPSGVAAESIAVSFSDHAPATWEWDGEQYLRAHGSTPHETVNPDGDTERVSSDVVVVLKVREFIMRDPVSNGTSLPTADTVGEGNAIVFYNGEVVKGNWSREKDTDKITLTNKDGTAMVIPPGRLWVALVPKGQPVTWE